MTKEKPNGLPERLTQEEWEAQLRRDAVRLADENLNDEADAW